jgi:hypothetical protein
MALRSDRRSPGLRFRAIQYIIDAFDGFKLMVFKPEESSAFLEEMELESHFTRRSSRVRYVAVRRPSFASYF